MLGSNVDSEMGGQWQEAGEHTLPGSQTSQFQARLPGKQQHLLTSKQGLPGHVHKKLVRDSCLEQDVTA